MSEKVPMVNNLEKKVLRYIKKDEYYKLTSMQPNNSFYNNI